MYAWFLGCVEDYMNPWFMGCVDFDIILGF
jgi:hypothetical protein